MMIKTEFLAFLLVFALLVIMLTGEAAAFLQRVGPIDPALSAGNFPAWYQGITILTLTFCDPQNHAAVDVG